MGQVHVSVCDPIKRCEQLGVRYSMAAVHRILAAWPREASTGRCSGRTTGRRRLCVSFSAVDLTLRTALIYFHSQEHVRSSRSKIVDGVVCVLLPVRACFS